MILQKFATFCASVCEARLRLCVQMWGEMILNRMNITVNARKCVLLLFRSERDPLPSGDSVSSRGSDVRQTRLPPDPDCVDVAPPHQHSAARQLLHLLGEQTQSQVQSTFHIQPHQRQFSAFYRLLV